MLWEEKAGKFKIDAFYRKKSNEILPKTMEKIKLEKIQTKNDDFKAFF